MRVRRRQSGTWMLFEADSFGGKTFEKAKDSKGQVSGQLTVVQVKDGEGNVTREQLWFTRKLGFSVIIR